MGHILTDLKAAFKRGDIHIQYIYINVGVFVLTTLIAVFLTLFNRSGWAVLQYFELPASVSRFLLQPWSLFTYMFMHADFMHILFNMLWLYWFGNLFLYFFSAKHFRGLYILGGICGGLLYMVAYNVFPYFRAAVDFSFLLGASASVLAVVVATAYREPNFTVNLLFLGRVRLKYIALFMVLSDMLLMTAGNAGGHIAHLGGALAGLWFAVELNKGRDVTRWINKLLDWGGNLFKGGARKQSGKSRMKVHYGTRKDDYEYNARKKEKSEEIDRILDKLKKSGYDSLSADEKKSLFDASKK